MSTFRHDPCTNLKMEVAQARVEQSSAGFLMEKAEQEITGVSHQELEISELDKRSKDSNDAEEALLLFQEL